jgi:hypothetical protein
MKNHIVQLSIFLTGMKSFLILIGLFTILLCACQSAMDTADSPSGVSDNMASKGSFGAPFEETDGMMVQEVLNKLDSGEKLDSVVIFGRVKEVCQVKGCWMEVCDTSTCEQTVFVQFLDYGFFMPKDLAGATVLMKGQLTREEVSVYDLQHYARDAGKPETEVIAIQEPEIKITFMASGVRIL